MVAGYTTNIETRTRENEYFREVLFTAQHMQLVVMALQPGEEIGAETHDDGDQFIRVESGSGEAILDGQRTELADGSIVVIPGGTHHNIRNISTTAPLKLYTIYAPPEHPDGTVNRTKADAVAYEAGRHH